MSHAVVTTAEGEQVVGVGGAAVFPVADVVDLQVVGPSATGYRASTVSVFDRHRRGSTLLAGSRPNMKRVAGWPWL